ncbi:hypothetical protein ON010_g13952 [Phytophthora cinnamomi]|nr:hypothetical protein ON010_g13952 [Phytophthora cinnamomi]
MLLSTNRIFGSTSNKIYGYLEQHGRVGSHAASTFIDSGASFNAVSPRLVESLQLPVRDYSKPLIIRLGSGSTTIFPRRVVTLKFALDGFPPYSSKAFVLDIPEGKDILLGMPWLVDTNPDIDWKLKTVRPRDRLSALAFHPCVPVQPARCIAGQRRGSTRRTDQSDDEALLNYYYLHGHHSDVGTTRLVRPRHLRRLLRECDNEFCFFVNPSDEPSKADLAWEKLKTSPAYPLVIKFRDKVFRSHLPAVPPTRQAGTDAKIELEDDVPIHRKQFPVSAEQREAIRAWTAEMLDAKMIRPSTSPYCAPTFCVKKRTGEWRIVHDFRGLNTKIRVPANPIPRKDDILRAMAKGKLRPLRVLSDSDGHFQQPVIV